VLDHLRIIRLSLTVDAFAADATSRLSGLSGAIPFPYVVARVAVLSFGSELVPAEVAGRVKPTVSWRSCACFRPSAGRQAEKLFAECKAAAPEWCSMLLL
jgi:hypothetical protein